MQILKDKIHLNKQKPLRRLFKIYSILFLRGELEPNLTAQYYCKLRDLHQQFQLHSVYYKNIALQAKLSVSPILFSHFS